MELANFPPKHIVPYIVRRDNDGSFLDEGTPALCLQARNGVTGTVRGRRYGEEEKDTQDCRASCLRWRDHKMVKERMMRMMTASTRLFENRLFVPPANRSILLYDSYENIESPILYSPAVTMGTNEAHEMLPSQILEGSA